MTLKGKEAYKPGIRYGRLIIRSSFIKNNRRYCNCVCDCGGTKNIYISSLKAGATMSCGCIHKEFMKKLSGSNRLPNHQSAFNALIYKYKLRAKKEKITWKLSEKQARVIFEKDCRYCGAVPERVSQVHKSFFIYNGIDRIDNTKGYILSNCAPCCMRCNYMKSDLFVDEFYLHIENIWRRKK